MSRERKTRKCSCGTRIYPNNVSGLCKICFKKKEDYEKIIEWKKTGSTGCVITSKVCNCIRNYIFLKQDGKCDICKISNIWNNKKLNFILDHIDGDASNNRENNLRLICSNCDCQLDTYKSKNKNSARIHRCMDIINLKYYYTKNIAKKDGILFNLSLDEYEQLLENSNISKNDIRNNKYSLVRYNDNDYYSINNCKFILNNIKEKKVSYKKQPSNNNIKKYLLPDDERKKNICIKW